MREGENIKTIVTEVDDKLHAEVKIFAVRQGKTVKQLILGLIQKELEAKKEQTQ